MKARRLALPALLALTAACEADPAGARRSVSVEYGFQTSAEGWTGGFADYPVGEEEFYELETGLRALPAPLDTARRAIYLSGNNHSDDLFMFVKRQVSGLQPGTRYRVSFEVEFATDAPAGCVGVGGSPGESVWMKAGASAIEPQALADDDGFYRMNVDKGQQSADGSNTAGLGVIGTPDNDCHSPVYRMNTLESAAPLEVTTDAAGRVWLLVGTDSGFEATTRLYYTSIKATLDQVL